MCYTLLSMFERCLDADYITVGEDASYAIQRDGETLFILFEHSRGEIDWKNNLDWKAEPYSDMQYEWYCHGGFLRVWKSVKDYIRREVKGHENVKSIVIVGYSHGAALALLCHEYIWYNYSELRESIYGFGFGCPRVICGKISAEVLSRWKNFFVIRNGRDAVTHLPPSIFGFKHVGKIIKVGSSRMGAIDAHRPENYIDSLRSDARCYYEFSL